MGAARSPQHDRDEIRLRHGAVRRVHRARRRATDAELHHAGLGGRRQAHHSDRGDRRHQGGQGGAERLDRGERTAVRVLPVGPGHGRGGAPRRQSESERRRHRFGDERKHLPLRHLPPHPCGHQARRKRNAGMNTIVNVSRRAFLKASGGLMLGLHLPEVLAQSPAKKLAGGRFKDFAPNAFVRIGADNTVTVIVKHLEMGQGTYTGLPTLVAEELDAAWSQIRAEGAPADAKLYNNLFWGPAQGTGGSTALANSYEQLRKAGATARAMLVAAAADKWKVPAREIRVSNGVVSHGNRKATFGDLATDAAKQKVPEDVPLKDPNDFVYIGKSARRTDARAKSTGTARFTQDVKLPGMLTAVVLHPPR